MGKDLSIRFEGHHLNIRCGIILRYGNETVLEVSRLGLNSVIPGGRIQIGESSRDAALREMKEEMKLSLDEERLSFVTVLENFFVYGKVRVHEIFFVYEYELNEREAAMVKSLDGNMDNESTYFRFSGYNELEELDLLPVKLRDIIRQKPIK